MKPSQLGPYRIGKQLGRGGMGTVYAAQESSSGRKAAVKVLAAALAAQEGFRDRFDAEIESLKKLEHPNIVQLYGYGQHDTHLYYAMELVEGASLEDELVNGRRFSWREVCAIGVDLCHALKLAHDHGIVHRDIKPANLLWSEDGHVKLTDFGIARLFGNTGLTSEGGVLGTAEYMAPEQADGQRVTYRCDLYSLGGVMYALLAGRPPFVGTSMLEMLQMQRFTQPEPVRRYAPETPVEMERIISQLLEKDPKDRFPNALIVGRRLEAMERGLSVLASSHENSTHPEDAAIDEEAAPDEDSPADVPSSADRASSKLGVTRDAHAPPPSIAPTLAPADVSDAQPSLTGHVQGTEEDAAHAVHESEPPLPRGDRFTTIEEARRQADRARARSALISPATWGLIAAIVSLALVVWYWLQPPTADSLMTQIQAVAGEEDERRLLTVEREVNEYLRHYPSGPHRQEVKGYRRQIEALHMDRRAAFQARRLQKRHPGSPLASPYLAAIELTDSDPDAAVAKLQLLVDLYGDDPKSPASVRDFVDAAKRQLQRLTVEIRTRAVAELPRLEQRLNEAQRSMTSHPDHARKICQALVTLYEDKPWAADVVIKARTILQRLKAD